MEVSMPVEQDNLEYAMQNLALCAESRGLSVEQLQLLILKSKCELITTFDGSVFGIKKPSLRERINKVTRSFHG